MPAADRAAIDYALGHALLDGGRIADAVAAFRRAATRAPHDPEYRYMLGLASFRAGDNGTAEAEFRAALQGGLAPADAERARSFLATLAEQRRDERGYSVETQLSVGYDSNYFGGREIANQILTGVRADSPEIVVDVEARARLAGSFDNGLLIGDRVSGLFYTASEADNFSLLENSLYLEGQWTPRDWLRLTAFVDGYLMTSGIRSFGLYQAGARFGARATFYEGLRWSTRLRFTHTFIDALQDGTGGLPDYRYMSGNREELLIAQRVRLGGAYLSLGYALQYDAVGVENQPASALLEGLCVLPPRVACPTGQTRDGNADSPLRTDAMYRIPYSFVGNGLVADASGQLPARLQLTVGARYDHRNYLDDIAISPAPRSGYTRRRVDDRLSFDLALKRDVWRGVELRLSAYVLFSLSTVDNTRAATPYDFDDKNYIRWVGTVDLLKAF
jgi:hypothetical protein